MASTMFLNITLTFMKKYFNYFLFWKFEKNNITNLSSKILNLKEKFEATKLVIRNCKRQIIQCLKENGRQGQTLIYKTPHIVPKFVEHESHKTKNVEVNSHAPEVQQCGTRQIIQRNH